MGMITGKVGFESGKNEGVMDGETGESMEEEEETDVGCGVSESLGLASDARLSERNWKLVPEMR